MSAKGCSNTGGRKAPPNLPKKPFLSGIEFKYDMFAFLVLVLKEY